MGYRVSVGRRAERQIHKAGDWWLRNRSKAPFAFADDLDSALDLLEALPAAGEPVATPRLPGLRRLLIPRIRYFLYYLVDDQRHVIDVLSLWHASRARPPRL